MSLIYTAYAEHYDTVFGDRPYESHVDEVLKYAAEATPATNPVVCDMGCGTGTHLQFVADAGFPVIGVDRSPSMLAIAREKLAPYDDVELVHAADSAVSLSQPADVVLSLFSSLNHNLSDAAVERTLENYRANLDDGGLFLLDMVDPEAARKNLGGTKVGDGFRLTTETHHVAGDVYELFREYEIETDNGAVEFQDQFSLRFFERSEIETLLERAGFEVSFVKSSLGASENRLVVGATDET